MFERPRHCSASSMLTEGRVPGFLALIRNMNNEGKDPPLQKCPQHGIPSDLCIEHRRKLEKAIGLNNSDGLTTHRNARKMILIFIVS